MMVTDADQKAIAAGDSVCWNSGKMLGVRCWGLVLYTTPDEVAIEYRHGTSRAQRMIPRHRLTGWEQGRGMYDRRTL